MKDKILLGLVILLALTLRLYRLDSVPPGLYFDEASIAYNAYSIIQTGKDEFGTPFPVLFRSYGDYKPGGYIYAVSLAEKVFGANDFAVRLPSALAGTLAVALVYFLIRQLGGSSKWALLSAWCLAVVPWHLWFSRGGFESNLAVTLVLAAVVSFFAGLKKHRYFWLVLLFLVIASEIYLSARVVGPGILAVLLFLYRNKLRLRKGEVLAFIVVIGAILFFLKESFFSSEATGHMGDQSVLALQKINAITTITNNFVKNISFDFLFFRGDQNPLRGMSSGVLFFWQLIFIPVGAFFLIKKRLRIFFVIISWLVLGSLPAVLSKDSPQAIRALSMVVPWQILTGFGLLFIPRKAVLQLAVVFFLFLSQVAYLHSYYVHIPSQLGLFWGDGVRETMEFVKNNSDRYQRLYVQEDIKYAYYLWYLKYDPGQFQAAGSNREAFGKFQNIGGYWREDFRPEMIKNVVSRPGETNWLLVPGWLKEANSLPGKKIRTVTLQNGEPGYLIYEL